MGMENAVFVPCKLLADGATVGSWGPALPSEQEARRVLMAWIEEGVPEAQLVIRVFPLFTRADDWFENPSGVDGSLGTRYKTQG
jgi:hypothetical protein